MTAPTLSRAALARPATVVAPRLCGALLVRDDEGLAARVVEAEAYTDDDPACHARRGRTPANASLFAAPGTAYVYRSYGVHWLLNVATGAEGRGEGVLLRAAEPLTGLEAMRGRRRGRRDAELLRGPGRLAEAFGVDGVLDGSDLCGGGPLRLADDGCRPEVVAGPRVGVSLAADWPRRHVVAGSPWASRYVRSPRAQGSG